MAKNLKQLTPQDVFFVGGETKSVYQHTGGLILLQSPEGKNVDFESYKQHMIERIRDIPHFRWKLHQVPLGLDLPYWVEDENFSFDNHIKRIALPSPGDKKSLAELSSYLYSRHMDRNRPLWETWFIEGLGDGKFAVLQKLHHCMMDGEGATQLGAAVTDFEPNASPPKIPAALRDAKPGKVPALWTQSLNATRHLTSMPFRARREIVGALRKGLRDRIARGSLFDDKPPVPVARFNGPIGSLRGFVFGTLPLSDIKALKTHYKVTVNDVILALVGTSMRNYLIKLDELPEAPLRAFIAVSLRTDKDDEFSNRVTSTTVTLGTDISSPIKRLKAIAAESEEAKQKAHEGGSGFMEMMQILPPMMVNLLMKATPPSLVPGISGANLLVSNVRGSPVPMYMAGAQVTGTYPMSIITPGGGINITCISYMDNIDIGVTFEPELFPDQWLFIDGLNKALAEYMAVIRKTAKRKKKTASTRSKRGANGKQRKSAEAKNTAPVGKIELKDAAQQETAPSA